MTFEQWCKTDSGKKSLDFQTLRGPSPHQYLKNRLYHAFHARDNEVEALQKTIEWYEEKLKKLRSELEESKRRYTPAPSQSPHSPPETRSCQERL